MTRTPLTLIDRDYGTYVAVVNEVLGSLLITMDALAADLDRTPATIRTWVRTGTFPPPVKFGGWQKFWLRDEVDDMRPALDGCWSQSRKMWQVAAILHGRLVLMDWLLSGCPLERSSDCCEFDGEDD